MNYAAFRGKNEYSGDKIGEKKFFANMNTCWATVHCQGAHTVFNFLKEWRGFSMLMNFVDIPLNQGGKAHWVSDVTLVGVFINI